MKERVVEILRRLAVWEMHRETADGAGVTEIVVVAEAATNCAWVTKLLSSRPALSASSKGTQCERRGMSENVRVAVESIVEERMAL